MFSWYKYLIVSLVFSHLGFWSGSLFLIAHFPDLCLRVLFFQRLCKVALIGQVMSEKKIIKCYSNMHVHSPGANFFMTKNILSIWTFSRLNDILPGFPIQIQRLPKLTLQ